MASLVSAGSIQDGGDENGRARRSNSLPNMTQISPKRRRSFGSRVGSKMWSMVSRRISRPRARSMAKDDGYDVEYGIDDDICAE